MANLILNIFNEKTQTNLLLHGTLLIIIWRTQAEVSVMYSLHDMQKSTLSVHPHVST
jgi:phage portal protein BeeE